MSRPVVVIQSGDAFENRQRALPVAVAAAAHGWDPVVLVDDLGAASLFLAHGIGVVAVGDLDAAGPPKDFDDVDPDELAPLALAAREASGKTLGAADWSDILAASRRLWRMLDDLAPSAIFVWNGYTGVWANALRVYKARKTLPGGFMERGPLADAVFVDRQGVNGDASFATPERAPEDMAAPAGAGEPTPPGLLKRLLARFAPAEPPPLASGRDRVIFAPLQVADDSNILLHSARIRRMRDLVLFALALARALGRGWRVVARPHPEERSGAKSNLPSDPLLAIDAETPLETYLDRAAVCLTVNSNVGLSAALAGAVVVTLGEGIYCREPFVAARQDCDLGRAVADIRRRLDAPSRAPQAHAFMERLAETSLFRLDDDAASAAARLERCGIARRESGAAPDAPARLGEVRIERAGPAFREALARKTALKAGGGEIAVDFDFEPDETLFLTYRRNREPLTRDHLIATAEAALGGPVRLSPTHRALGRRGAVLMTHSRRLPEDVAAYDLVLDEFGLPHARLHRADAAG